MGFFQGKFWKAAITGGLAGITVAVGSGVSFSTLEEAKHVLVILAVAFGSGIIHAVWNYYFPAQNPLL